MDFWFPISEIPEEDKRFVINIISNKCIKIQIPNKCPSCKLRFLFQTGTKEFSGCFIRDLPNEFCSCDWDWPNIWNMRIKIGICRICKTPNPYQSQEFTCWSCANPM